MNRIFIASLTVVVLLSACSLFNKRMDHAKNENSQAPKTTSAPPPENTSSDVSVGGLRVGEASGSCTAEGKKVELKYAYAGRDERFGEPALVVIVTDKPIPPDAVAEEIKSQTLFDKEEIRGLEYVVDEKSMWVRFHPSQYQETTSNKLKDYAVEGDIVRGTDEKNDLSTDGKYSRTVKFVARIIK